MEGTYAAFGHVVGIMHDVSGQAKVTDLHNFPLCQEDVAGSQVPVDTLCGKERNHFRMAALLQDWPVHDGHLKVPRQDALTLPSLTPPEGQRVLGKGRRPVTSHSQPLRGSNSGRLN